MLTATGETLAQIQDRVLGVGVNSRVALPGDSRLRAPSASAPACASGAHELIVDVENLNDENYRGLSWGMDAPGRGLSVRYVARF